MPRRMYKGKYSGVSIWFNPEDNEILGYNLFCDFLLNIVQPVDNFLIYIASFFSIEPFFQIEYNEKIYRDFKDSKNQICESCRYFNKCFLGSSLIVMDFNGYEICKQKPACELYVEVLNA